MTRCRFCAIQIEEGSRGWEGYATGSIWCHDDAGGQRHEPSLDESTVADNEGIGPW